MNRVIFIARLLFIALTLGAIYAAVYVSMHTAVVNGNQALTVVITAGAFVGAIASWQIKAK